MTDDQLLEYLDQHFETLKNAQGATASVTRSMVAEIRSLVTALREADRTKQQDENEFAKVKQALLELIGHVSPRDLSKISGEELIDLVPIETIRNARDIHWARSKREGLPLPPTPNVPQTIAVETSSGGVEVIPVIHQHRRRGDVSSVTIKQDRDGKTRIEGKVEARTLGGWLVALIVFAALAWREIQHAYNEPHPGQEQRQAPTPSLPVPQLAPPSIPSLPSPTGVHP